MKIAVDVMGTDYGPKELVKGAVDAVRAYGCEVILVGDEEIVKKELALNNADKDSKISICHAGDVIAMDEHPAIAVRRKKDASIVVASKLLRENKCDALISAGSTGAAVTSALFCVGRIPGVDKPCIATTIPSLKGISIMLDSGAFVDAKPKQMVINAVMGSVYAQKLMNIKEPRVGLLNIGSEETKGNELALATYPLLKELKQINFIGNVEGNDIPKGNVDVVVCDAFVGNVALKFGEGLANAIMTMLKDAINNGGFLAKIGALLLKPALVSMKKRVDVQEYGGALLLGVKGPFMICHGNSKAKSIQSAIRMVINLVEQDIVGTLSEKIAEAQQGNEEID